MSNVLMPPAIGVVAQKLTDAGVAYEVKARHDLQPNLLATLPGARQSPILMVHTHISIEQLFKATCFLSLLALRWLKN
jgi:hypothetical protein